MLPLKLSNDDGSTSLEFITAGLILLVPLVYLVLTMSVMQAGALAVEGASRQAARVYVTEGNEKDAAAAAQQAVAIALADYGVDSRSVRVQVECTPEPHDCLTRRGFVTVTVATTVPLPGVPAVLPLDVPSGVRLSSAATEQVSRFSEAEQ
jgi:Flp pilus assembly protein TadG